MIRVAAAILLTTLTLSAQTGLRGHWTGSVEVPNQTLAMEIDIDKSGDKWIGSIAIPAQGASGLPLANISETGKKVTFSIEGAPGDPMFTGTISDDGKTMSGDFTQGPGSFPFKFTREGEPKVEVPKASPAVGAEFTGHWEGTLEAGQSLRLTLDLENTGGGSKATLTSVDQGNAKIPVSSIQQNDKKLLLEVKAVGGQYEATLNKEGTELAGTWTQGGNELPLKMTKTKKP